MQKPLLSAATVGLIVAAAGVVVAGVAGGGLNLGGRVGGIFIDPDGVLNDVDARQAQRVRQVREEMLERVPEDLSKPSDMRTVSLRELIESVRQHHQVRPGVPLPQPVMFLAGLKRVQYIFVDPENKDILLAGPADGWKVDERGEVVGASTGLPVLYLDDLLTALRTTSAQPRGVISCSIDPTPEGVQRLNAYLAKQRQFSPEVKDHIERELGPQKITLSGVAPSSRLAHILVAADYRMKRYGMGLDEAPIPGMPSYLKLLQTSQARVTGDLSPRWWIEPDYKPLLTDGEGLAWELRPGIKVLTEDEARDEQGQVRGTGQANPLAAKWAATMTEKYDELAAKDTIFAELRNAIDLTVVGALIVRERLAEKAGLDLSYLLDESSMMVGDELEVPREVATMVSMGRRRNEWIITASGGVTFSPWSITERSETSESLKSLRGKRSDQKWWAD